MASEDPKAVANSIAAQAAATQIPHFLYVAASIINGRSWCGDCRNAEPLIQKHFPSGSEPQRLTVQYAGDPATWRNAKNPWRKFGVTALPTLFKVTPDGNWSKLVEGEVYDVEKLERFVASNESRL
ncbi:hypothetical protein VPNG_01347 [Cytospora leucostoma]|uniref:Thioredoxin domain-containing protein n=1 Tax=Cytospora leucostoma TaxID=1230097 RepID=A0A423XL41_9PEZI|nr:hypothetical protein VPNG_01347 [Cytospora leucostoma]